MKQELVLITGMSGSGKSVALNALEDAGYYCVDNLPPELLLPFVQLEQQQSIGKVAIAMDVRSASSLPLVPAQLAHLRLMDVDVRLLFLDATTEILVHRFSETRRRHPLAGDAGNLLDNMLYALGLRQQPQVFISKLLARGRNRQLGFYGHFRRWRTAALNRRTPTSRTRRIP